MSTGSPTSSPDESVPRGSVMPDDRRCESQVGRESSGLHGSSCTSQHPCRVLGHMGPGHERNFSAHGACTMAAVEMQALHTPAAGLAASTSSHLAIGLSVVWGKGSSDSPGLDRRPSVSLGTCQGASIRRVNKIVVSRGPEIAFFFVFLQSRQSYDVQQQREDSKRHSLLSKLKSKG